MARKLTLILALLAISFIANATITTDVPITANYNVSPVAVFTNSTDAAFANLTGPAQTGQGFDNTTLYVWAINNPVDTAPFTIVRRSVNATSLSPFNSSDATITTTAKVDQFYNTATGPGYFAVANIYSAGFTGPQNLSLTYVSANSTTATTVVLTANGDMTVGYGPLGLWYDTGVFYIVYSVMSVNMTTFATTTTGVYLQGVTVNGSLLYTSPLKVLTISDSAFFGTVGPTMPSNSSSAVMVYTLSTGVVSSILITFAGSGSVGSAVTIATGTNVTTYMPAGIVGSTNGYGVAVSKNDNTTGTMVYSTLVYVNGSSTATLNISATSGYQAPFIMGYQFTDGFGLFEVSVSLTSGANALVNLQNYFKNGTVNGSAIALGVYGSEPTPFIDTNGALWVGYTTEDSSTGKLVQGFVGKVIAQLYSGANVLTSIFAFVALMVAALFAF